MKTWEAASKQPELAVLFIRRHHIPSWNDVIYLWDSILYGLVLLVGVPAMAWLVLDLCWKFGCGMVFFAMTHLFWPIEWGEPLDQMDVDKEINPQAMNLQQNLILLSFLGGIGIPILLWIIGMTALLLGGGWWAPHYGPVEWFILAHSAWVGWKSYNLVYRTGFHLGTGSPRASHTNRPTDS